MRRTGLGGKYLAVVLVVIAIPVVGFAWDKNEHQTEGSHGYTEACRRLGAKQSSWQPIELARYQEVCDTGPQDRSTTYGQAVALAGDHIGQPDEFVTAAGEQAANSTWTFLEEALHNAAHFHPLAIREFRDAHAAALRAAIAAAQAPPAEVRSAFDRAFFLNAYADHFLEDAFSAGHTGFCRSCSSPTSSKLWHDRLIATGRWLQNARGQAWCALGDARFHEQTEDARNAMREAQVASILSFLYGFVHASVDSDLETAANALLPVQGSEVRIDVVTRGLNPSDAGYSPFEAEAKTELVLVGAGCERPPVTWSRLELITRPAFLAATGELSFLMLRGLELGGLASYTWSHAWSGHLRLGPTIGFAHHLDDPSTNFVLGLQLVVPVLNHFGWPITFDASLRALGEFGSVTSLPVVAGPRLNLEFGFGMLTLEGLGGYEVRETGNNRWTLGGIFGVTLLTQVAGGGAR
jgi:hypothetical protein